MVEIKYTEPERADPEKKAEIVERIEESSDYPWDVIADLGDRDEYQSALKELTIDGDVRIDYNGRLYLPGGDAEFASKRLDL